MDVPSIHHVQIAIPEGGEDAARIFYGDLLGFPESPKPENLQGRGGVWFRTENLDLHLGIDHNFSPATKAHVAFWCRNLDDFRPRLAESGCDIVNDEPLAGFDRFYTSDPFGNRIELLE